MQSSLQLLVPPKPNRAQRLQRLNARDALAQQIHATLSPQHREALGQVLTPPNVADFMSSLMSAKLPGSFVDAGAGYGMLSDAGNLRGVVMSPNQATLVDLDPHMASFLRANNPIPGSRILETDFISWSLAQQPDLAHITANPPYLSQKMYDTGLVDAVNAALGSSLSKLTNLFALFLLCGARLLASGGRLVCIIPTEIFTTNYGAKTLASLPAHAHLSEVHIFRAHNEPF
jgi:methylase of polypeptide subunit release factors